jgi:5-enolpyruvylshikimate-3-phosphate synthase
MASAVAALQANGNVEIEEAESINKSYPNFYDHLQKLEQQFNIHNCKSVCLVE